MLSSLGVASLVAVSAFVQPATAPPPKDPAYVLGYTMKTIDGKDQPLSAYKGKVVMIVNVASKCGNTPQYEGLEALYAKDKDAGLVILGFPANEFGGQEPGTNAEIKEFCTETYHVTFPMFGKIVVKGEGTSPLYRQLAAQPAPIGGEPKWNFTKFLVDRQGHVVARFEPKVKPDDPALVKKIEELLHGQPTTPREPEPTIAGS
ncbi:MAG: glutathione peroxidase [Phycisphaerales bacterium]|nr:glutathione peroxidase [Phycisphaerales bacterium]